MTAGNLPSSPRVPSLILASLTILLPMLLLPGCGDDDKTVQPANSEPTACFTVTPETGTLRTEFTADATCSSDPEDDDSILEMRWDWDNDGTWESDYAPLGTVTHHYGSEGTWTIRLQVRDSGGLSSFAMRSVTVSEGNTPPTACFVATPDSGTTETPFDVYAGCSTDAQDALALLEARWDWESDGTWDTAFGPIEAESHQYLTPGDWTIALEVRDTGGLSDTAYTAVKVTAFDGVPTACFTVTPDEATTDYPVEVDASCSQDVPDPLEALEVRWDWEDDGVWDTVFDTAKTAAHTFDTPGFKLIRMQVRDTGGKTQSVIRTVNIYAHLDEFALAPAGSFHLGSPGDEPSRQPDETLTEVTLSRSVYVCEHEVTRLEWAVVMGWIEPGSQGDQWPVDGVTWFDCIDYCNRRSEAEGLIPAYAVLDPVYSGNHIVSAHVTWSPQSSGYRLPTEAEWEYACRAGAATAFCNGAMTVSHCLPPDPNLEQVAWYCANALDASHDIMRKDSNGWGLFDIHGNVAEWCWDWYGSYDPGPLTDPTGPVSGTYRILRGGSWYDQAWQCRCAYRGKELPETISSRVGLRVVRTAG